VLVVQVLHSAWFRVGTDFFPPAEAPRPFRALLSYRMPAKHNVSVLWTLVSCFLFQWFQNEFMVSEDESRGHSSIRGHTMSTTSFTRAFYARYIATRVRIRHLPLTLKRNRVGHCYQCPNVHHERLGSHLWNLSRLLRPTEVRREQASTASGTSAGVNSNRRHSVYTVTFSRGSWPDWEEVNALSRFVTRETFQVTAQRQSTPTQLPCLRFLMLHKTYIFLGPVYNKSHITLQSGTRYWNGTRQPHHVWACLSVIASRTLERWTLTSPRTAKDHTKAVLFVHIYTMMIRFAGIMRCIHGLAPALTSRKTSRSCEARFSADVGAIRKKSRMERSSLGSRFSSW